MNYLEGKIVIATGGTSGLGKSLVLQLINLGAKVLSVEDQKRS